VYTLLTHSWERKSPCTPGEFPPAGVRRLLDIQVPFAVFSAPRARRRRAALRGRGNAKNRISLRWQQCKVLI
jgi:hypothetical protein